MPFDLIVGVDFGMSGTAVCHSQPDISIGTETVRHLRWDSESTIEKVPTRLAYNCCNPRGEPISWGMHVPVGGDGILIQEWFKTKFGQDDGQTTVEKHFLDYLTLLYAELSRRFTRDVLRGKAWADANVAFYFSTPSIWDSALVGRFKELIEAAGFGQAHKSGHGLGVHTVHLSLVEPQATVAMHLCSKEESVQFKSGHCVLVVDAGAGTADLALLHVRRDELGASRLDEKSPVHGGRIGSSYIDQELESRIAEILRPHGDLFDCEVDRVAWDMRCSGKFQDVKHIFGNPYPNNEIPVPHLKDPKSSAGDRIQNGMLIDIQNELEIAFDKQVGKIRDRIQELMSNWRTEGKVDYLLLSGGLGSSDYVQEKLRTFCKGHDKLKDTQVVASSRPRMAVSMGLVYDAMRNQPLLAELCSRSSFGLVFRMPNDDLVAQRWRSLLRELKQAGWLRRQDPIASCVDWFIKKGTKVINGNEVTHTYRACFEAKGSRECAVQILASPDEDPSPSEKDHPQRRVLMRVDLSHSKPTKQLTFWRKSSYVKIEFLVKATIRPAEVHFRCVDNEGKEVSSGVSFPADGGHNMRPLLMGLGENEE